MSKTSTTLAELGRLERGMYVSLARWAARRPRHDEGETAYGYAQAPTPIIWVFIGVSAIEIPVLHLILPWTWAQIVAIVVGIWGLVWMLGLLAALHVHPHVLGDRALRVRNGAVVSFEVPLDAVASVRTGDESLPSSARTVQPIEEESGTRVRIGVSGRVNVHLALNRPVDVELPAGPMTVTAISLCADEPRTLATALRRSLVA